MPQGDLAWLKRQ